MVKYVFFDLDETLIDIKFAQNEAIKTLYFKYGFNKNTSLEDFIKKWDELTEYYYKFYTAKKISYVEQRRRRIDGLFRDFCVEKLEDSIKIYDIYLKDFENAWCVYDDVIETLKELKNSGYGLGLISNGDYSQQVQKMKKVGIYKLFDYVNTSSQYEFSKPDIRLFETIFNQHNINFDEVVYVGDSYKKDVLPCRELGIRSILIDRKNRNYEDDELIKIESLNKLNEVINNLNK